MSDAYAAGAILEGVEAVPGARKPHPLLTIDHVRRSFGGVLAVDVDILEFERHAVTALIGPNGAGKTTLFNLLTGFDRPDTGAWSFDGRDVTGMRPEQLARAGMVRTFQLTRALAKLTVRENIMLGAQHQPGESIFAAPFRRVWQAREHEIAGEAEAQLNRFGLAAMADERAGTLSGGQRKLLEMARALMSRPKLIMLDEPTAGVNPALTQTLLEHIIRLPMEYEMTVIFVEHDMDVVHEISDWVVAMAEGSVIAEGPPGEVARNRAVVDAYLGQGSPAE